MIDPKRIFHWKQSPISSDFDSTALAVFRYQAVHCPVYRQYLDLIDVDPTQIRHIDQIPYLPIEFFKTQRVVSDPTGGATAQIVFTSSGTTGAQQSRHEVLDIELYVQSFRQAFDYFYGSIQERTILALLPSYQEREGSSLIYMVDDLIAQSQQKASGYFLHNHRQLFETLIELKNTGTPTLLIGVTYALLDFAENFEIRDFDQLIVMETGGMKGRRREMIREEVHMVLRAAFGVPEIHSEYGMTELLSQAYSKKDGLFQCPPWMKVRIRDTNDPFTLLSPGRTGGINIIDLANYHSCSFIATQDLGRMREDESFEVLGRFDHSDIRGCNLLVP